MDDLTTMRLGDYLEALASDAPAPGGGAVAALTAAQGAALLSMAHAVTKRGHGEAPVAGDAARLETSLTRLRQRLTALASDDGRAFGAVLAAYKVKATEPEAKAARKQAIDDALKGAAAVPLEVMRCIDELHALACDVAGGVKPTVASDAVIAARLLPVALKAAADNVRINLALSGDAAYVQATEAELERLLGGRAKAWRQVRKAAKQKRV
jgi:formiminotetrahydrofolate cyclodeaminase